MKNISTFVLLFLSIFLYSQSKQKQEYVYLKRQTDSSQTFKASIANQPVTIFLLYKGVIDCRLYEHYVDGWYYYDKYKIMIPLTGIYRNGEISLYNFTNEKNQKNFKESFYPSLIEKSDSIAQSRNVNEIIKFNYDFYSEKQKYPQEGYFLTKGKKYPAKLFAKDNTIYRENEYLIFPNGRKYNTYDIINTFAGNKLLSVGSGKTENRIVLKYNHSSTHNGCGYCGADPGEEGYRMLTFDKEWNLKTIDNFKVYSCMDQIFENSRLDYKNKRLIIHYVKPEGVSATIKPYKLLVNLKEAFVMKSDL